MQLFLSMLTSSKKRWMLCPSKEMTRTHRHICCQVFRVFQHELELFPSHGLKHIKTQFHAFSLLFDERIWEVNPMVKSHFSPSNCANCQVNRHLLKDLISRGLWNDEMRMKLIAHNGSHWDDPWGYNELEI